MGFGLIGAGAAVSGLMEGYQKGRKFARDEERFEMEREKFGLEKQEAEQRKRLREGQIESVTLSNRKTKAEIEDEDQWRQDSKQIAELWESFFPSESVTGIKSAPTVNNPVATGIQSPPATAATAVAPQALPVTPGTAQGLAEPTLGPPRRFFVPQRSGAAAVAPTRPAAESAPSGGAVSYPISMPAPPLPLREPADGAPAAVSARNPEPSGNPINRAAWMANASLEAGGGDVNPSTIDPNDSNYDPGSTETPKSGPVYTVDASTDAPRGISTPGGRSAPGRGPSLAQMEEFYSKANAIALRRVIRKDGVGAAMKMAIDMGRIFSDAKIDAGIRALNLYDGTNDDVVKEEMARSGVPLPEGTRFERKELEVIPGTKFKTTDVVAISPDGKKATSLHQLMQARMSPKEIFDRNTEIGKAAAQVSHYESIEELRKQEIQLRREDNARSAADAERRHRELMARFAQEAERHKALFQQNQDKFAWDKYEINLTRTQKQFEDLYGYQRLTESDRIKLENGNPGDPKNGIPSDLEKAEQRAAQRLGRVSMAMTVFEMNRDALTNKPLVAPAEVKGAIDMMVEARGKKKLSEIVKIDELGRNYVEFGGKKVFVPREDPAPASSNPPPATGTTPPPSGSAAPSATAPVQPQAVAASQVSDNDLLAAYRARGYAGFHEAILGPRPGIRNVSGTGRWDADAAQLDARLRALLPTQRTPSR